MKKRLYIWQLAGFLFTSIAGVLLHFLYDWSGQRVFVALFSAVNESIWEHMKLVFFPMILFALIQNKYAKKRYDNFWSVKFASIITGVILIPVLYYTYIGVTGRKLDWLNILIFFIAVATAYITEIRMIKNDQLQGLDSGLCKRLLLLLALIFFLFTFRPPQIPIFQDPLTGTYGIFG